MAARNFRGVGRREEINSKLDRRDVRPLTDKIRDAVETGEACAIIAMVVVGAMLMFPQAIEIITAAGMLFFMWVGSQKFTLSFRLPIRSRLPDYNDRLPGSGKPATARGIAFLGNEFEGNRELWFNKSDMCTHILVFGSTGAGKALRDNEPVMTPSGWRKMSDLSVGEAVMTPSGLPARILEIHPQGEKELWRVHFDDGRWLDTTTDHLWGVRAIEQMEEEGEVTEVLSLGEIEHRIFSREGLGNSKRFAVPMAQPCGDAVRLHELTSDQLAEQARASLESASVDFPAAWVEGSIRQRESTWNALLKMGQSMGETVAFDSANLTALRYIQKLAWSLGKWARIEPWNPSNGENGRGLLALDDKGNPVEEIGEGPWSLVVKKARWLSITSIEPTHRQEECRCIKIDDTNGLFVTRDWITTHNTETLISLAYNTLSTGSGFIYVDGKGDNSLWAKIFSVVRSLGREDDLLVINFMTGGRDMTVAQTYKPSNTLNPFTTGSAAGLTELLVGLMDDAGGDGGMWKGRAISLITAIMLALVWMRDNTGLLLDVDQIREHLVLDNIQTLAKRRDLPPNAKKSINAYLKSLPGYVEGAPKQSETVTDQHGYLQMQFTRILGSLSETYGHIFRTNLGEVDFFDVVLNRRILVVLLPAMEKSTDELANLGKIIVGCLKQMMATGLGDVLEGDYADVIERKPTTSPSPYMCILDEYGYYVVKGASVMPAQARSLGFCMVFAGQDYPAFKKNNNAEEAVSTIGNCNIKIFMKLEDPTETYDLAEKSIGKANIGRTSGLSRKEGGSGYYDGQNAQVDRRERADWLDFKDHSEGEAHIIFKSTLVRANMFFANPSKVKKLQLNSFLRVEPPKASTMQEEDDAIDELIRLARDPQQLHDMAAGTLSNMPARLRLASSRIRTNFAKSGNSELDPNTAGMAALAEMAKAGMQTQVGLSRAAQAAGQTISLADIEAQGQQEGRGKLDIFRSDLESEEEEDERWDHDPARDPFEEDDRLLLRESSFTEQLSNVQMAAGSSADEAQATTETIAADMRVISTYPRATPDTLASEDYADLLSDTSEALEDKDD